jgi:membrane protease YdiL (CAAX protease family)
MVVLVAMGTAPTLATLVCHRLLGDGRKFVDVVGLRLGPIRRWWLHALAAWLGPLVGCLLALMLAVAAGVFTVDLKHFSGFAATLSGRGPLPMPLTTLVAITGLLLIAAPFITTVPAMLEEIGWRGFLRDCLRDQPRWVSILATGVLWALWHAPVILLGYNYPSVPPVAALGLMVVFCTLVSALFEWLRGASGTLWVSGLAHGSFNSSATLAMLISSSAAPLSNVTTGLLGWTGWFVMAVSIVVLVGLGRLQLASRADVSRPFADATTA